jgi:AcrR family transcriptional regulator
MRKTNASDPVRHRRPQHSDDKLLSAATSVFAGAGYGAATVDAIAEASGATKPTLYARYGAKADLYRAAVRRERDIFLGELFAAYVEAESEPVAVLVERAVHAWFDYADRRPEAFRLLFAVTEASPAAEVIAEMRGTVTDRVTQLIVDAMRRLDQTDRVTAGLVGAMIVGACVDGAYRLHADSRLTAARASRVATAFVVGAVWGLNPRLLEV